MSRERTISALPVELLTQIIIETCADNPSAVNILMRISRIWYNTTINAPYLWNTPSLDLHSSGTSPGQAMRTARRCIERSGSVELDITIRITSDELLCDCFDDEADPPCERCVEWIESHRGPVAMLAGRHLARWRRLEVWTDMSSDVQQLAWIDRVLAPLVADRPTPRLRTLSFEGWSDVCLSFSQAPLLQEVTLREAPHFSIADWGCMRRLGFSGVPSPGLAEGGACTVITHLILHMPIMCSHLTFPNVTHLEILDSPKANYSCEPPALPRVQGILISTNMEDLLPNFPLDRYPTMTLLSLRYQPVLNGPNLGGVFIPSLSHFIKSYCTNLEALDVDSWLLPLVKSNSSHLPNLKQLFLMGEEVELPPTNASNP
jgi:hypothetical protein